MQAPAPAAPAPVVGQIVRFRENETTTAAGYITRVWAGKSGGPYVTISSEGRTFVRLSSRVTIASPVARER